MTIPYYIGEDRSDMRGIKPGWYAIEDDGNLSSGPFPSLEECITKSHSRRSRRCRPSRDEGRAEPAQRYAVTSRVAATVGTLRQHKPEKMIWLSFSKH